MKCRITPSRPQRSRPKGSAAPVLALAVVAAAMNAQIVQRLDISGYVSPKCWGTTQTWAAQAVDQRVRCNSAEPQLNLRVREINSDGSLSPLIPASWDDSADRGAVEILVTPNL